VQPFWMPARRSKPPIRCRSATTGVMPCPWNFPLGNRSIRSSLKGQMTHRATLGTDPRGNLTRIDNALAQMPQRLEAAKAQLDNLYQQQAAAKEEVGKPFLYEEELRSKNARLVELDTLLNIDGKGQAHAEAVVAKSARPSVLDHLKRPATPRSTDKKPKQHEEVR